LSWSVLEAGEFAIGYRQVEQTYTQPSGEDFTIPVSIWYPTGQTNGEAPMYYGIVEDTEAVVDAEPAASAHEGGYPVLIFSHGSYLYGASSSFLARHFASHGWIVAAPDHVGNLLIDYGTDPELPIYYQRPLNDAAALDAVSEWSEITGAVTDRIVLSGYSFGGYDTWASIGGQLSRSAFESMCKAGTLPECSEAELSALEAGFADDRIVAAIAMAGAQRFELFAENGLADLSVPVMQLSGTEDDRDDPQQMWDATGDSELTWVSIEGGCHEMFSAGGCPGLSREDGFSLINAYSLAYARQQLLGDSSDEISGLLAGSELPWPMVDVSSR
jgi:predicted dienelactone hydrolase